MGQWKKRALGPSAQSLFESLRGDRIRWFPDKTARWP